MTCPDPDSTGTVTPKYRFCIGVQWHPEFHKPEHGTLDDTPLLHDFLAQAHAVRAAAHHTLSPEL